MDEGESSPSEESILMARLKISHFSCIDCATFETGDITVLIGPQASGKSVICKMHYFFFDILQQQARVVAEGMTFEAYKEFVKERFYEWFPPSAWGKSKFVIEFHAGECEIRFSRTGYRGEASDNFRIWTSEALKSHYANLLKIRQTLERKSKSPDDDLDFNTFLNVYEASSKSLAKLMSKDGLASQFFVPAGRSFFTSIGKAVSAFEHSKVIDPSILNFGRLYAQLRDRSFRIYPKKPQSIGLIISKLNEIFGGEIKSKGNEEYVLSTDGRKIPFSALSSGQQELLPLITVLPHLLSIRGKDTTTLAYIEEPEAHLFPGAQSKLIEALAGMVNSSQGTTKMVLSTHSPYVLSKFNNLIKAGELAGKLANAQRVEIDKIIPKQAQLPKGSVRAYAIVDRKLVDIIDSDGLIAADYLDEVSGEISCEFSDLLSLEFSI